jgi:hypothetical protein
MFTDMDDDVNLNDYKRLEIELHGELMKTCRRYSNRLGIISVLGILDIVRQETIELEKATRHACRSAEESDDSSNEEVVEKKRGI